MSKKLKSMNRIISFVNNNLTDSEQKQRFSSIVSHAISLTERKRYYVSNYGFKNSIDYILNNADSLISSESYDRFYLDNIVSWWKNKAEKRYNSLKEQSRLKTTIELQSHEIDSIR